MEFLKGSLELSEKIRFLILGMSGAAEEMVCVLGRIQAERAQGGAMVFFVLSAGSPDPVVDQFRKEALS